MENAWYLPFSLYGYCTVIDTGDDQVGKINGFYTLMYDIDACFPNMMRTIQRLDLPNALIGLVHSPADSSTGDLNGVPANGKTVFTGHDGDISK